MNAVRMSIGELADAAGISRRAVRFYVQRGLLPTPSGLGRGRHYDEGHLNCLRQIQKLQAAGHSLDAIGRILQGESVETITPAAPPGRVRPALTAELWTRVRIAEGIELHFDTTRRNLTAEELLAARDALRAILGHDAAASGNGDRQEK
jgi:DNA-binding transcriptional MerR regulator